jgi:2-oxoglutarate dehydrogenase complex dehydrogenase (E1) component-like enzyme
MFSKGLACPSARQPRPGSRLTLSTAIINVDSEKLERVMDAFRRWGYLQANLDPLGHFGPLPHPELDSSGEAADAARRI